MSTTKTTTLAALVLAAGLALTACSNTPAEVTPAPAETVAEDTQAPAPEATEPVTEPQEQAPQVGDVLTEAPANLEPSQRAFPLADGTFVLVDRYEPLPEVVQAAVSQKVDESVVYTNHWNGDNTTQAAINEPVLQAQAARGEAVAATNKNVMVVYRTQGQNGCNGTGRDPWTILGATAGQYGGCASWASQAEAVAAAEASVAAKQDANTWIVVVDNG